MNINKGFVAVLYISILLCSTGCSQEKAVVPAPLSPEQPVKGWMILSDNEEGSKTPRFTRFLPLSEKLFANSY
ncbi:hypothetical protein ACG2F4_01815 [Halalkalibaculum sp. DA3122]|uniref:hypothetical protein n=1 Tax=Halalkalibaculum sp. DA3122 TaxID=3373607 RepID=UPI003754958A